MSETTQKMHGEVNFGTPSKSESKVVNLINKNVSLNFNIKLIHLVFCHLKRPNEKLKKGEKMRDRLFTGKSWRGIPSPTPPPPKPRRKREKV